MNKWNQRTVAYQSISVAVIFLIVLAIYIFQRDYSKVRPTNLLKIDEVSCYPFWMSVEPFFNESSGLESISKKMIINNLADYNKLNNYRSKSCSDELPVVDFSKSTVLGSFETGSCAAYKFERKYYRNDESKVVRYYVRPVNRFYVTSCSGSGKQSMNFIEVPKIPADYKVMFGPSPDVGEL